MTRSTWILPILIALASLIGLVSALTGDGWRDVLSWVGLGVPLAATLWAVRITSSSKQQDAHKCPRKGSIT